jgi:multidrug efflux pump
MNRRYVATVVTDALSRITGVASIRAFGSQLAMRIWLDPFKLNRFKLMPSDVRNAILAQNTQIATGGSVTCRRLPASRSTPRLPRRAA